MNKPYIEPRDKAVMDKYKYLYKGYLKGYVPQEDFINYCQEILTQMLADNKEVLENLKKSVDKSQEKWYNHYRNLKREVNKNE